MSDWFAFRNSILYTKWCSKLPHVITCFYMLI